MMFLRGLIALSLVLAAAHAWGGVGEGREQPVRTTVNGIPVYSYGATYVLGQPPDFFKIETLQEGNTTSLTKIKLKKSWEIKKGYLGGNPPRIPRTEYMDQYQAVLLPINLIDGNNRTYWSSRSQGWPDVQPEWIRLDLPIETTITAVKFVRRYHSGAMNDNKVELPEERRSINGDGIPRRISIKVSRDARNWDEVYHTDRFQLADDLLTTVPFTFSARPVKQIWIKGEILPYVSLFPYQPGYSFSLADVQVIDTHGDNVALASRGTGVTVSSAAYGYADNRYIHDDLWPTAWDLGFKWMRVNPWEDILEWSYVEREKGKYVIDAKAEQAIKDASNNGIRIVMALAFSNWLYTPQGKRPYADSVHDFSDIAELPPLPLEGEFRQAWLNYVRHMVSHFKGVVNDFTIWNEPHSTPGYGFEKASLFVPFYRDTVKVIKEINPQAVMHWPTSTMPFFEACLKEGIGPLLDLGFPNPQNPAQEAEWKKLGLKVGPGTTITWEFGPTAPYPFPAPPRVSDTQRSEIQKAREYMNNCIGEASRGRMTLISEWYNTYNPPLDTGLFRNGFSQYPFSPVEPQPAYYVYRNMNTLLDETEPGTVDVQLDSGGKPVGYYTFLKNGRPYVAFRADVKPGEIGKGIKVDVRFAGKTARSARAYDCMNGWQQELKVEQTGPDVLIRGLLIPDGTLFVELGS